MYGSLIRGNGIVDALTELGKGLGHDPSQPRLWYFLLLSYLPVNSDRRPFGVERKKRSSVGSWFSFQRWMRRLCERFFLTAMCFPLPILCENLTCEQLELAIA